MNALKCVENNYFCMFNSRRAIPWLVHSCTPINVFNRIIKTSFYSFYKSIFFCFSLISKHQGIYSFTFLWNHSLQATQVALNRPLSMSGSELKKGTQWQYNWTRCVIDLPRLVLLLDFGNGSKSPLCRHRSRCFLISCRS